MARLRPIDRTAHRFRVSKKNYPCFLAGRPKFVHGSLACRAIERPAFTNCCLFLFEFTSSGLKFSTVRFKSNYDTLMTHLFCAPHTAARYILHIAVRRCGFAEPASTLPVPYSGLFHETGMTMHRSSLRVVRASRPVHRPTSFLFLPHSPTLTSAYFVFSLRWTVGTCLDLHRPSLAPSHSPSCNQLEGPDVPPEG
jgi:hypothetical protein